MSSAPVSWAWTSPRGAFYIALNIWTISPRIIEWNGISFSEVWCSGQIDAYLTDIGIGDINSDNNDDLILSMVLVSGIGKFWKTSPSKILIY